MSKSKLGFHIDIQTHLGQVEKMIQARPAVTKVISSMGLLQELHRHLGDDTVFIARDWNAGDDFSRFIGPSTDMKEAARRWFRLMRPSIKQAPFAYWESFNEMADWSKLDLYNMFEVYRQHIMARNGYKCCVGNFAVGTPEIVEWRRLIRMLRVTNRYGNILGLHEYGGLYMDMWYGPNQTDAVLSGNRKPWPATYDEGWLFGRYRKVYNKYIKPREFNNLRIVFSEFGLDMVATDVTSRLTGETVGAWKTCQNAWARLGDSYDGPAFYAMQLAWADMQMQYDPYVVGATIFTWGTFNGSLWANHDIEGPCADLLVRYIEKGAF